MKTNNLRGWKKIFQFTLQQNLKTSSTKIFLLVFLIIGLASMPLLDRMLPANDTETEIAAENGTKAVDPEEHSASTENSPIETIYFVNNTDFPIEDLEEFVSLYPAFSDTQAETGNLDFESWEKEQNNHLGDYQLHVSMTMDEMGLNLTCEAPLKSFLDSEDLELFEYSFAQYLEVKKLEWSGLSKEQLNALQTPVNGSISHLDENGEPVENQIIFNNSEYWTSYGIIILTIFIIAFSAEGIAVSVLTEKSSKIVEYLMMSVKPLALIIGKTLAMLSVIIIQFGVLLTGLLLSCFINGYIQKDTFSFQPAASMEQFFSLEMFHAVNPGTILLAILLIVAGVIFYCTLAGIAGASVSRMEEIGEALKLYNIILVIGAYFGLGIAISSSSVGVSAANYIAYFLPLSAPFIVPIHMILGKISPLIGLASLTILVVLVVLTFILASRIYANMLFYSGKPMKIKDLITFAKNAGKEAE